MVEKDATLFRAVLIRQRSSLETLFRLICLGCHYLDELVCGSLSLVLCFNWQKRTRFRKEERLDSGLWRSIKGCEISEVYSDSLVSVPDFGALEFVFRGGVHL